MKQGIHRKNITAFINALLLEDVNAVELYIPMLDVTFAKVELVPFCWIQGIISLPQYSSAHRKSVAHLRKHAIREVPPYDDALRCLVQAGGEFSNHAEIMTTMKGVLDRSPLRGDRTLFFAFDTNALIDRIYSNLLKPVLSAAQCEVGFVVAGKVREELSFHGKYSESEANELMSMESLKAIGQLERSLTGQNHRIERTKRIGHMELLLMQSERRMEHTTPRKDTVVSHEVPMADETIISAYKQFIAERQVDILLLTGDATIIGGAKGIPGLRICPLTRSKSPSTPTMCTYETLCNLIYLLAINFLVVDVRWSDECLGRFLGLWEGKTEIDWATEKVFFVSDHASAQGIEVDLGILEEIDVCGSNL